MSESTSARPASLHLPFALLALAIAVFLAAQIGAAGQQSHLIVWQMSNGEKQIANAKENEGQFKKLIEQQDKLVQQSDAVQAQYQKLFEDLLKLAEDDADAKAVVEKWKIQRNDNKEAAAAPAADKDKAPDKK